MSSCISPFAAIFDWDGVIIDSEACHREAWERLALHLGYTLPDGYFERSFGRKNIEIIPEILGWSQDPAQTARLALQKEERYREIVRERGAEAVPGVWEWLSALAAAGIPCAIASSTARENIELSLGLIGCAPFFKSIVSAEDVTRGKPAPDVFLTAASRLGALPERCIVFEDALVGLEAAQRAGMKCVAVATTNSAEHLAAHADQVVCRLDELDVNELSKWVAPCPPARLS